MPYSGIASRHGKAIASSHNFFKASSHILLISLHMYHPYKCVDFVKDTQAISGTLCIEKHILFKRQMMMHTETKCCTVISSVMFVQHIICCMSSCDNMI